MKTLKLISGAVIPRLTTGKRPWGPGVGQVVTVLILLLGCGKESSALAPTLPPSEASSAQLMQEKHALAARSYRVKTYPSTPEAELDSDLWFTASGRYVPLEREISQRPDRPEVLEHSRARFAASGVVAGVVVLRDHKAKHAYLRTPGRNLPVFRFGSIVMFLLPGPGLYHLRVADDDWERDVSIHADDLNKPGVKPGDPGVINVGALGIYFVERCHRRERIHPLH